MEEQQALSVTDRANTAPPALASSNGADVREVLRTRLGETRLSAAVQAVEAVVEHYAREAEATLGRPDGDDETDGLWPTVRLAMRRGVPAAVLQRSLWQAHLGLFDRLLGTAGDDRQAHPVWEMTTAVIRNLASFTVRCCEEVARVYAASETLGTTNGPDDRDRRQLLIEVLTADLVGDETGRSLGLSLAHHHWATVLWSDPGSGLEVEDLVRFALACTRAVRGSSPLVVVNRASEVWTWTSWPRPPGQEAIAAACSRLAVPQGLGASSGPVAPGVAGFRRSLVGARTAQRSIGRASDSWWRAYEEVSPVSLLTSDAEQARWFVEEVLGELGREEPWCATLRETLRLYLAHGRSRQQVAAAMYINRNTVAYRVQKASELLGRPIEEEAFDVRLALEIAAAASSNVRGV
jgi:hypothetical protein